MHKNVAFPRIKSQNFLGPRPHHLWTPSHTPLPSTPLASRLDTFNISILPDPPHEILDTPLLVLVDTSYQTQKFVRGH